MVALTIPTALGPNDPDDGDTGRQMRGMAIAARVNVKKTPVGYRIPSQSGNGHHIVSVGDSPYCSCPDFELRQHPCKHIYAVEFVIQRDEGELPQEGTLFQSPKVEMPEPSDIPVPEKERKCRHKNCKQEKCTKSWANYDEAQVHEGDDFLVLLRQLCDTVEQPEYNFGRPTLPLSDMIFGMAVKVYSLMSGRRAMTDVRSATGKGLMDKTPCYSTLYRYMEKPELTPILKRLIEQAAIPLASLETHFSPDSSGFASKSYVRWFDKKWGKEVREPKWVKAHIMSGALTNIVTAVEITNEAGNDSPHLIPFLNVTNRNFDNVQEISADKAYLSRANLRAIEGAGATPYIPFKTNSVGYNPKRKRDRVWERLFHYYQFHRDEFLKHYHLRSNVESTFGAIKAKFGASLRSKTDTAQVNECLVKILCFNIVALVHSVYEFGIRAEFFPAPADEEQETGRVQSEMELGIIG